MKTITTLLAAILCFIVIPAFSQNAPVTVLSDVYNPPVGGTFSVPVTIKNFEEIGGISLIFDFNPSVLTYQSVTPNAAFVGMVVSGATPGRIIISWYAGYGVTLPDDAHLLDIIFLNNGGNTGLNWSLTDEGSCEYAKYNGGAFTVLNDSPYATYYINGSITNSNGKAPKTWLPVITNASAGVINIPVKVNGFSNIGAVSLTFEYDPAVIQYLNLFTPNFDLLYNGSWQVGTQNAPGGKKYMIISWTRNGASPPLTPCSLPFNSTLITLKFNYLSPAGTTQLKWMDNGSSCEYADGNFIPLDDTPPSVYYQDGLITHGSSPRTVAPCITAIVGQPVVVPVRVYGLASIGALSLTLDYDPAVLTFQSNDQSGIPGDWSVNSDATSGRFKIGGFGSGFSLPDGSILFNLTFIYNGGSCSLSWYDDDISSCEYADATTLNALYDLPREEYYINGCLSGPSLVFSTKALLEGAYIPSSAEMKTVLNALNLIPHSQPYHAAPWNYSGTEVAATLSSDVTDWVLVELRTSPLSSSVVARRACLLSRNGTITDVDGMSQLAFPGVLSGYYYLVIYHRNHLPVMSANAIAMNPFTGLYDFSISMSQAYEGSAGYKQIAPGVYGMIAGNADGDASIYPSDYNVWASTYNSAGYLNADFDMDAVVYPSDYNIWATNYAKSNSIDN